MKFEFISTIDHAKIANLSFFSQGVHDPHAVLDGENSYIINSVLEISIKHINQNFRFVATYW